MMLVTKFMANKSKRVLLLSWRDTKNPKHGGAEIYVHEILTRLVKSGHQVTLFTANYPGGKKEETVNGVKVLRSGNFFSVHKDAINYYRKNSSKFDYVIDEFHGYPFLTNFYVSQPRITIIHEVAGEIWHEMFPGVIGHIGVQFEKFIFRLIRNQKFVTISESTMKDLEKQRISSKKISIVKVGNSVKALPKDKIKTFVEKSDQICFVGRLCRMKGVDNLILAFSDVAKKNPKMRLKLIGKMDPSFEPEIQELIKKHQLESQVEITGFISDKERNQIMADSKYIVSCSVKEGWGMIVTEANVLGTPAITFDVHGYREAIINGKTGYLAKKTTAKSMAKEINKRLKISSEEYSALQKNAYEYGNKFSWDSSSTQFAELLKKSSNTENLPKRPGILKRILVRFLFTGSSAFGKIATSLKII